MSIRGVLGPVYAFEWLTATRRWQMYAGRAAFVGLLLTGLALAWNVHTPRTDWHTLKGQAALGRSFHSAIVSIELLMVLLAAPAATAGAICLDKARGTLLHVLVTDLSDSEIVLGKLAARLVPVLGLLGASLPVLALLTLLGGVDPLALCGTFLVLLSLAVLGCALALALSVWGKKTHEVLLATYLVWIVWIVVLPYGYAVWRSMPANWVLATNPFALTILAHDPTVSFSPGLGNQVCFSAGALAVSAAILTLTVVRLRPVVIGQWGHGERRRARTLVRRIATTHLFGRRGERFGPTLDGNPVLWYEWHRRRPTRWASAIWGVYVILAVSSSAVALWWESFPTGPGGSGMAAAVNVLQVTIGLLLVSVTSATGLAEERVRGSLDILLATPLSSPAIVWGKWWGAYRGLIGLAILPALLASVLALDSGRWVGPFLVLGLVLAYGAALNSLGLLLATAIPRTGRVLGLSVGTFVVVTIGFPFVVIALLPHNPTFETLAICTVMGSPPFGMGFLCAAITEQRQQIWPNAAFASVFWTLEYATAASFLLIATLLSFDRCLGRIPDRWAPPRLASARKQPQRRAMAVAVEDRT